MYGDGAAIGKWLAGDEETSDVDVVFATIGIFPLFGDTIKFGWKFTKHKGDEAWSFLKTKVGRAGPVSAIKDIPGWKKVYDKYPHLQSKLDKLRDPGRSHTPKQHTGDFWENSSLVHLEAEDLRPSDINRRFHKWEIDKVMTRPGSSKLIGVEDGDWKNWMNVERVRTKVFTHIGAGHGELIVVMHKSGGKEFADWSHARHLAKMREAEELFLDETELVIEQMKDVGYAVDLKVSFRSLLDGIWIRPE